MCCDHETMTVLVEKLVISRKHHKCYECAREIKPGDKYEIIQGIADGQFMRYKTCVQCVDLREYVRGEVDCLCYIFGDLLGECLEYANAAEPGDCLKHKVYRYVTETNLRIKKKRRELKECLAI